MELWEALAQMRRNDLDRDLQMRMATNSSWNGCGAIVIDRGAVTHFAPGGRITHRRDRNDDGIETHFASGRKITGGRRTASAAVVSAIADLEAQYQAEKRLAAECEKKTFEIAKIVREVLEKIAYARGTEIAGALEIAVAATAGLVAKYKQETLEIVTDAIESVAYWTGTEIADAVEATVCLTLKYKGRTLEIAMDTIDKVAQYTKSAAAVKATADLAAKYEGRKLKMVMEEIAKVAYKTKDAAEIKRVVRSYLPK